MKVVSKIISIMLLVAASGFALAVGKININTADAETLAAELNGVGESKAEAIIKHREKNGPFESAEALSDVKGIGPKVLEMNIERIIIENE